MSDHPDRLPHGYTNLTTGDGSVVVKAYDGPDAPARRDRERAVLAALADKLPLPPLLDSPDGLLRLGFVTGTHAQELLAPGVETDVARAVLAACGSVLRRIHAVDAGCLPAEVAAGRTREEAGPAADLSDAVLVHADFGPNNLLLDPATMTVVAVLDWEFAHVGAAVEDLAWCEWIVRTHHPDRVGLLDSFFEAYGGEIPSWPVRKQAMLTRCADLLEFCVRWEPGGGGVTQWKRRLAETGTWQT